jgi:hypothetical protein
MLALLITAVGNITGGNVNTAIVSATGNVTGANLSLVDYSQ